MWNGKLSPQPSGDKKINRICTNVLRIQHLPEACASDLGNDQSHYLLLLLLLLLLLFLHYPAEVLTILLKSIDNALIQIPTL